MCICIRDFYISIVKSYLSHGVCNQLFIYFCIIYILYSHKVSTIYFRIQLVSLQHPIIINIILLQFPNIQERRIFHSNCCLVRFTFVTIERRLQYGLIQILHLILMSLFVYTVYESLFIIKLVTIKVLLSKQTLVVFIIMFNAIITIVLLDICLIYITVCIIVNLFFKYNTQRFFVNKRT